MSTHADGRSSRHRAGHRTLAWAVLAGALLQVIAPVVTINGPGSAPGTGSGPELLITPVGWAFSIWGVIYTLAIASALGALVVGETGMSRRLPVDLLVLYLGAVLWTACAALDSSLATAGALTLMFIAAVDGALRAVRDPLRPRWFALLARTAICLYAGWVTAAFFLNASTALVDAGAFDAETLWWQLVMLVLAAVVLTALAIAVRGHLAYACAGLWALLGIAVTGVADDTTEVTIVSASAAIVLVCALAVLHASDRDATAW